MSAAILGPLEASTLDTALPFYTEVSCGFPSPAENTSEQRLSLDELVHLREPSMFLVRAMGESMIGVGVHPGDLLVVDKAREAKTGDVVVACLGNEFTVKLLRLEPGRAILEPANPEYAPRVIGEDEELIVWGVCTWNMQTLAMNPPLQRSGRVFLLADMNSAYSSIETIFQPWLRQQPVVVLSSNDGNIVARNSYAKALGVKMGQPWHEIAPLYRAGRLHVFSSNFALYADISDRFMAIIARETSISVPYSIDEVWVEGGGMDHLGPLEGFCQHLRQAVDREIGIPIAIGAGHTKTQAKLANWAAKKWLSACLGVLDIREPARLERLLRRAPVAEVWGIGPRLAKRLAEEMNITRAWELAMADPRLLRRRFNVNVERTARELRGEVCFPLEEGPVDQQTIATTQSFGRKLYSLEELSGSVASFTARAAVKLRRQQGLAQCLQIFARTSSFATTGMPYSASRAVAFTTPTDDTREMIAGAQKALESLYLEGPAYAKAGVIISKIVSAKAHTGDLFAGAGASKSPELMRVLDTINERMGRGTLRVAREQASTGWEMRRQFLSPYYTTRWSDLPQVW